MAETQTAPTVDFKRFTLEELTNELEVGIATISRVQADIVLQEANQKAQKTRSLKQIDILQKKKEALEAEIASRNSENTIV